MRLIDILKLLIIGFIAPLIVSIGIRYIPGFSVTTDQVATILIFIATTIISAVKAKTYRTAYVRNLPTYREKKK